MRTLLPVLCLLLSSTSSLDGEFILLFFSLLSFATSCPVQFNCLVKPCSSPVLHFRLALSSYQGESNTHLHVIANNTLSLSFVFFFTVYVYFKLTDGNALVCRKGEPWFSINLEPLSATAHGQTLTLTRRHHVPPYEAPPLKGTSMYTQSYRTYRIFDTFYARNLLLRLKSVFEMYLTHLEGVKLEGKSLYCVSVLLIFTDCTWIWNVSPAIIIITVFYYTVVNLHNS